MKALGTAIALLVAASPAVAGPVIRSGAGANAAAIQATVDAFRNDVGNPNNGNTTPSQAGGRREVNWDGGGAAAPFTEFPNPMVVFQARGAIFTTPGNVTSISGAPTPLYGNLNPAYGTAFAAFSAPRLFAALNSNIVDVHFFVPGTNDVSAAVSGFGAVFTDVDSETSTKMEFFAPDGTLLGEWAVPASPGDASLSFLGVSFDAGELVGRVRITSGTGSLVSPAPSPTEGGTVDLVAMDDFIYGEPVASEGLVITPGTGQLFRTAGIDITFGVEAPEGTTVTGGSIKYNNLDVTAAFVACAQFGSTGGGDGLTLRCSLPGNVFPAGDQVLQVELNLNNGSRLRNAVRWTVLANTEP